MWFIITIFYHGSLNCREHSVHCCYENLPHSFLAFDRVTLISQHACDEIVDDLALLLGVVVFCVVNHLPERCHGDFNQGFLVEG